MSDVAERTFSSDAGDRAALAEVAGFLDAHRRQPGGSGMTGYALVGGEGERIELPETLAELLRQAVKALQAGRSVTLSPQSTTLTTQQAADLLGISRPTIKKLIQVGDLPATRVGNRHRLDLADVLAYDARRRDAQLDMIARTSDALRDEDPDRLAGEMDAVRAYIRERRSTRIDP